MVRRASTVTGSSFKDGSKRHALALLATQLAKATLGCVLLATAAASTEPLDAITIRSVTLPDAPGVARLHATTSERRALTP